MDECSCIPYRNTCCCGPINGIFVAQPTCQRIIDGTAQLNPVYMPEIRKSFWTYKMVTDCQSSTRGVSSIVIPICNKITESNIIVYEKINGCTVFNKISFEIKTTDPFFGSPPEGYNFLKIETSERFDKGVCVAYLLEIQGDYPTSSQNIEIKAGDNKLVFDCDCFLMPTCPPEGKLITDKKCEYTIENNHLTLHYEANVSNIGAALLDNVLFTDTIFYDTSFTMGTIKVVPELSVNTSIPGQIVISGNLGTINPSQNIPITYDIDIASFTQPGEFAFADSAIVVSGAQEQSASCNLMIKAAKLKGDKCCIVDGSNVTFRIAVENLSTVPILTDFQDKLTIPEGLTVQFLDFDGCTVTFESTGLPVNLFTDIVGPESILIENCGDAILGPSTTLLKNILLDVKSISLIPNTLLLSNTLREVKLCEEEVALLLPVENVPVTANTEINANIICTKPCIILE